MYIYIYVCDIFSNSPGLSLGPSKVYFKGMQGERPQPFGISKIAFMCIYMYIYIYVCVSLFLPSLWYVRRGKPKKITTRI